MLSNNQLLNSIEKLEKIVFLTENIKKIINDIKTLQDKEPADANILISNIRKELLLQLNKPTYKNIFFLSILHEILIFLAKKYPINDIDIFSRTPINEILTDRLLYVSTGHVYDMQGYLEYLSVESSKEKKESISVKNINTNENFNEFDLLHINFSMLAFYNKKNDKLLSAFFEKFSTYLDLNEHFIIDFLLEKINQNAPELLKEVCSYGLCLISKKYSNRMQLFDTFFNLGKFHPDELHYFSETVNHLSMCFSIVINGKNLYIDRSEPMSLLRIAALHGNVEVTDYLIKNGANVNLIYTIDHHQKHVLFDVIHGEKVHRSKSVSNYGYGQVTYLLLENGANTNLKIEGMTAQDFSSPSIFSKINYNLSYIANEGPFNIYAPQCKTEIEEFISLSATPKNAWQIPGMRFFNRFIGSQSDERPENEILLQRNTRSNER